MEITFLGTGTSHGVPMIGCECSTCRSDDPRDSRLRPSIFVRGDAGTSVLIDAGPDLRAQALKHRITRVDAIVFTHGHADHILGLDDVRRFNAIMGRPMKLYGDAVTLDEIRRTFGYVFDPDAPKGGGDPAGGADRDRGPFAIGELPFVPVPVWHGTQADSWSSDRPLRLPDRLQRDSGRVLAAPRWAWRCSCSTRSGIVRIRPISR